MNRQFPKENIEMVNKDMQRWSTGKWIIYHSKPPRMGEMKNTKHCKVVKQSEHQYAADKNIN